MIKTRKVEFVIVSSAKSPVAVRLSVLGIAGLTLLINAIFASGVALANSAIFFHADGCGLSHWTAFRIASIGPDGRTSWDKLPYQSVYRGHLLDSLSATSNAGATIHAYGVKVNADSFGMNSAERIKGRSGFDGSIYFEAKSRGKKVGLIQTGIIAEPGTAAFASRIVGRENFEEITKQVLETEPDVLMGGGEKHFLPQGTQGRFGEGVRKDGVNLIEWAKAKGYTIVYTKDELANLDKKVSKVLGVFASDATFFDKNEEDLIKNKLPNYVATAPTVAEMSEAALAILKRGKNGFLLVVEEEGTDNFSNVNNAAGALEAGQRALQAIDVLHKFVIKNPRTLLLSTSDSDASGMEVLGQPAKRMDPNSELPPQDKLGGIVDGKGGTGTLPFVSGPDRNGNTFPFAIGWIGGGDATGGIIAKAAGYRADRLPKDLDNTEIYSLLHSALFKDSKFRGANRN